MNVNFNLNVSVLIKKLIQVLAYYGVSPFYLFWRIFSYDSKGKPSLWTQTWKYGFEFLLAIESHPFIYL